ncbi:carbohydrate ABC transporter substrate-binding protein [Rhodophyticola sp. CCM32]|nr:carbohydrate ABC transporter substrate-binding protein [Rhodophyticola sp. CCM32]
MVRASAERIPIQPPKYKGLTWDHPRGYDALAEAARRVNAGRSEPLITWDKQPLEGFESAQITDLTARYDLVVLDHPHIGEAVAENCLIPLEEMFSAEQLADWEAESVGPSFRSYQWDGLHWALPLDVATQVAARRPDRIAIAPTSWDEIDEIAQSLPVALSLGGPHGFLNLISMAASEGVIVAGDEMLPDAVALPVLERLQRLARLAPQGTAEMNPIALLEAMGHSDEIALIPLVFAYVTYARAGHAPHAVAFSDTPRAPGGKGGVLGGTGVAFSRRCMPDAELRAHTAALLSRDTQRQLFPEFGGQPSARSAWTDPAVNAAWGNFYADTLETAEHALLRPRFDRFPAFTNAAASRIRLAVETGEDETRTFSDIRALWRESRASARGDLDDKRD